MKHLKKYETYSHHREDIIEILNNWIDDLNFDISKEPDGDDDPKFEGIVYSIKEKRGAIALKIYYYNYYKVENDDKIFKDFRSLGNNIDDLYDRYKSHGYTLVCLDHSTLLKHPHYLFLIDTYNQ